MTPEQQMLIAVLSSSAVTGALVEAVRAIGKVIARKRNVGITKMESEVDEMHTAFTDLSGTVTELKEADKVILHDRIWDVYYKLQQHDDISVTDRANLDYIFEIYRQLGGNHQAEVMYNELLKKPVRREKE